MRLFPGASGQNILRRLQLLCHNRYLDRPALQVADFRAHHCSTPMVYALGTKGHELLAEEAGSAARSDWTAKNRALKPTFYRHTLMVSGILIAFEAACRSAGTVRLIPWEEILATKCPPETRKKAKPQTWRVRIPGKPQPSSASLLASQTLRFLASGLSSEMMACTAGGFFAFADLAEAPPLLQKLTDAVLGFPGIVFALVCRQIGAIAALIFILRSELSAASFWMIVATSLMVGVRHPFGQEGSDQMIVVVCTAVAVASSFPDLRTFPAIREH